MTEINASILAALSTLVKADAAKDAKGALPAGSTTVVDFTVRVTGTLTKAATGVTVADSTALPWSSVLALAMHRSGMHADTLRGLCVDVLAGNLTDAERAAVAKGDAMWDSAVKPLLPKRTNAPSVKANLTTTIVD